MITLDNALHTAIEQLAQADIENAALDATVLLQHATQLTRLELMTQPNRELLAHEHEHFSELVARRLQHEPVAYLTGKKEFWGLDFTIPPTVLIPRPDSETLIATLLAVLPDRETFFTIADVGCGSGALIISILHEYKNARGIAIDINTSALRTTAENAVQLGVAPRLTLQNAEWLSAVNEPLGVVISNPPYIPTADIEKLAPDVRAFEPHTALDGGADGLNAYRTLIPQAYAALVEGGLLLMEIGYNQAHAVCELCVDAQWSAVQVYKDLAGNDRVVMAVRAAAGGV